MPNIPQRPNEWYASIPFSDLNMLINQVQTLDAMKAENAQLRREMDGLRNLYSDLLIAFGELRRELKKR